MSRALHVTTVIAALAAVARAGGGAPAIDLPAVAATSTRPITVTAFVVIASDGATETTALPDGIDLSAMAPPPPAPPDPSAVDPTPGILGTGALADGPSFAALPDGPALPDHAAGVITSGDASILDATLVIADRAAPAARVLDTLITPTRGLALGNAALAVSTPGGARALQISFGGLGAYEAMPAYLVVVCGESDAHLTAAVGGKLAPKVFDRKVKGDPASIAAAYRAARKVKKLGKDVTAWIQLAPGVSAGRLIAVLDALGAAGAWSFALAVDPPTAQAAAADHPATALRLGEPTTAGGTLDGAVLRRYIKRSANKLEYCYEKELRARPGLAGTVTETFTIAPNGTVAQSTATAVGLDDAVTSCVADVIHAIEFPKPHGDAVTVTYPITFVAPRG